jgi:type II secretory pathway component PulK
MKAHRPTHDRAFSLTLALGCLAISVLIATALMGIAGREKALLRQDFLRIQAEWLVESGVEKAAAQLAENSDFLGERWSIDAELLNGFDTAIIEIRIEKPADRLSRRIATVRAIFPATTSLPKVASKTVVFDLDQMKQSQEAR